MWIERKETGWIFGEFVKDRKITTHITRNSLKDVFLFVNGRYIGLLEKGRFFFSKELLDRIVYTPRGQIELYLKTSLL